MRVLLFIRLSPPTILREDDHHSTLCLVVRCRWDVARPDTESYFRGYGEAPGGIEKVLAAPQARI